MYVTNAITGLYQYRIGEEDGGRTGNIQIRTVDVFPRGLPFTLTVLCATDAAGPGLVQPREEQQLQLFDDVRVGHVEMVLDVCRGEYPAELREG